MEVEGLVVAGAMVALVGAAARGAAVLTKVPPVALYVAAGILIGPETPFAGQFLGPENARILFDIGMVLALFFLGLEFRVREIVNVGGVAALAGATGVVFMTGVGFAAGRAIGLSPLSSAVLGGVVAISSTTLVLHSTREERMSDEARRVLLGVALVEDVAAATLIGLYSTVGLSGSFSAGEVVSALGRAVILLFVFTALAVLVAPRLLSVLSRPRGDYPAIIGTAAVTATAAGAGTLLGFSPGLGAFIMGAAAAQSDAARHMVVVAKGLREAVVAFFFVTIGLLVSPTVLFVNLPLILLIAVVAIVGKTLAATTSMFLLGETVRDASLTGTRLARFGEFSVVLAGVIGTTTTEGAVLFAAAAGLCIASTLSARPLGAATSALVGALERGAPRSVKSFSSAYRGWMRGARSRAAATSAAGRQARHLMARIFVSAVLVAVMVNLGLIATKVVPPLLGGNVRHDDAAMGIWFATALLAVPGLLSMAASAVSLFRLLFRPTGGEAVLLKRLIARLLVLSVVAFVGVMALLLSSGRLAPVEVVGGVGLIVVVTALVLWRSIDSFHRSLEYALHESFFGGEEEGPDEEALVERLLHAHPEGVEMRRIVATAGSGLVGLSIARGFDDQFQGSTVIGIRRSGRPIATFSRSSEIEEGDVILLAFEGAEEDEAGGKARRRDGRGGAVDEGGRGSP
ncbi:MAG: cation:proton antiporter [Euryarchaeota archaeon]|nr:cation:proton antiporter [Euryarchaeota archaeon]